VLDQESRCRGDEDRAAASNKHHSNHGSGLACEDLLTSLSENATVGEFLVVSLFLSISLATNSVVECVELFATDDVWIVGVVGILEEGLGGGDGKTPSSGSITASSPTLLRKLWALVLMVW